DVAHTTYATLHFPMHRHQIFTELVDTPPGRKPQGCSLHHARLPHRLAWGLPGPYHVQRGVLGCVGHAATAGAEGGAHRAAVFPPLSPRSPHALPTLPPR